MELRKMKSIIKLGAEAVVETRLGRLVIKKISNQEQEFAVIDSSGLIESYPLEELFVFLEKMALDGKLKEEHVDIDTSVLVSMAR